MSYITGLGGSGTAGYFTDITGNPKFMLLEQCWALPYNAGRWNGGNWQADMDGYMAARSSQGFTAWFGTAWSDDHIDSSSLSGGRSWDGVYPFTVNGTPGTITSSAQTIDLNDPFWTRLDYLFNVALTYEITCFLNIGMQYDFSGVNNVFYNLGTAQATVFGGLITARYPASAYPNVFFFFGDDGNGGQDTLFTAMMSGITAAGDTRPVSTEQLPETNSHIEFDTGAVFVPSGFGMTTSSYNWAYTYCPSYNAIEQSYTESGTTPIPVVLGDGVWYGDTDNTTPDYTARRNAWWALASGARGINGTSGPTPAGDVWQWQSAGLASVISDPTGPWCTATVKNVVAYYTSLAGWHKLIPDTSNALVTAGRGTKTTNSAPGFNTPKYGNTDAYVAASKTPDGSLAVIYCGQHFSITVDQSKMLAGYGAKWVDPASCAITTATAGSTYNSTPLGNNSAGNPGLGAGPRLTAVRHLDRSLVAVTFDAVGPSSAGKTGATSPQTWTHTCTAGASELLVGVAVDSAADSGLVCAVTYNSVGMTSVLRWQSGGTGQTSGFVQVFRMASPPTGSAFTVSVAVTGTGTFDQISGGSISFAGSTALGTAVHSDSAAASVTTATTGNVLSTSASNLVAGFLANGGGNTAATAGTSRFLLFGSGGAAGGASYAAGSTIPGTGGNVAVTWSQNSDWYAAIGLEVQISGAGGVTNAQAVLASGQGAAKTADTIPHTLTAGPGYATTATDLGGGAGSWATPQYAEGGP